MNDDNALARMVEVATRLDLEDLDEVTLAHIGVVIADTVGVMVAGSRRPEILALAATLGEGPSELMTLGGHASPGDAAFLNATAGAFLELDEGTRPTGHPAIHVVPPALAVAQAFGCDQQALAHSVAVGYEVAGRLFTAFRVRFPVHPHGNLGAVGGAVAVAVLAGVDPVEAALCAAATPVLGVWNPCFEGATVRNTFTGLGAQAAVRATELVRAGFTGSASSLSTSFGQIAGEMVDESVLTAPLDPSGLRISQNYFKRHSACALTHAALDAALALRGDLVGPGETAVRADDVRDVVVEAGSITMRLDRRAEPNSLSTRFSLPYAVATALLKGSTWIEDFEYDAEVAELAKRVRPRLADDLDARWPNEAPARVTVTTAAGESTVTVDNPRGHFREPLDVSELREKFVRLVGSPDAGRTWDTILASPTSPDPCALLLR